MTTTMNSSTNLAAKSVLARLMAAEDISVTISPQAPTASFDMMDRVLTLPVWNVGDEAYNMLVGHEVSHALYTPAGEALATACKSIDPKNPSRAKDYLNVVEDARIERAIKQDYPGLRKSFAEGYREFITRDLFRIAADGAAGIAKRSLIDRINLHYKIGWVMNVPFTAEELPLVQEVARVTTWDDVVDLSRRLYELAKQQKAQEQEPEQGDRSDDAPSPEAGDEEGGESSGPEGSDGEDRSDEFEATGEKGEESDEQGDSVESPSDEQGDEGDGGQSSDEQGDEGDEGDQSPTGKQDEQGEQGDDDIVPDGAQTIHDIEKGLADLTEKKSNSSVVTLQVPKMPKNFVLPISVIEGVIDAADTYAMKSFRSDNRKPSTVFFEKWKSLNAADVSTLWTEFERRKAADAHRRTVEGETGVLNPNRLHAYKVSEDIFLRSSIVRDGKNHGLVLLLDMSGSMANQMLDTAIQLVNLTAFARRANIPFVVYGFLSNGSSVEGASKASANSTKGWTELKDIDSRLITLFESGMTATRWSKVAGGLLAWARAQQGGHSKKGDYASLAGYYTLSAVSSAWTNKGIGLRSTPTNAALIACLDLVPEFRQRHKVQIVNTIILTDGEASDRPLTRHEDILKDAKDPVSFMIEDPQTRRTYPAFSTHNGNGYTHRYDLNSTQQQGVLVQMLRDRTGSKVININLVTNSTDAKNAASTQCGIQDEAGLDKVVSQLRENGYFVASSKTANFDQVVGIKTNHAADSSEIMRAFESIKVESDSKTSIRKVGSAWIKSLGATRGNRSLMTHIADLVSK